MSKETVANATTEKENVVLPPSATPAPERGRIRLDSTMIAKARDFITEDVEMPEWPGSNGEVGFITIKALSGAERDDYENSLMVEKKNGKRKVDTQNARARLVVRCAIDEHQNRIWGDQDATWLGKKNAAAISRLYDVAARLAGITPSDEEEMAGNSKAATSTASS